MLNLVMLALICSKLFLGRVLVDWGEAGVGDEVMEFGELSKVEGEKKLELEDALCLTS